MTKFAKFQQAYDDSIARINQVLDNPAYEAARPLIEWLLVTDINPHQFMPSGWEDALSTAGAFDAFVGTVLHAMYDDGDMVFVRVGGAPRMVFADPHSDGFHQTVLNMHEKYMITRGSVYDIEVMTMSPTQFVAAVEEHHTNHLRQCFIYDAGRHGVDWSTQHHSGKSGWNPSWVHECQSQILKHRNMLQALRTPQKD